MQVTLDSMKLDTGQIEIQQAERDIALANATTRSPHRAGDDPRQRATAACFIAVADSGVGIPEK